MMTSAFTKKAMVGALAALTVAGTLAVTSTEAEAQWRRHHHHHGGGIAAGVVGGLALGALAAGAANPYYGHPGYGYGAGPTYYGGPSCYLTTRRVWDGYGYRRQRVEVCN